MATVLEELNTHRKRQARMQPMQKQEGIYAPVENPSPEMKLAGNTPKSSDVPESNEMTTKKVESMTELYDTIDKMYNERKAKEEEELRSKNRNYAIVASIADGLNALSNLYATTGGASARDVQPAYLGKLQDQYDKTKAEYDAERNRWRVAKEKAMAADLSRRWGKEDAADAAEAALAKRAFEAGEKEKDRQLQREKMEADKKNDEALLDLKKKGLINDKQYKDAALKLKDKDIAGKNKRADAYRRYNFNKSYGSPVPVVVGDEVLRIGENALDYNIGNLAGIVKEDIYNSMFGSKDESELSKDEMKKWFPVRRAFDEKDPKKLREIVMKYVKDSPAGQEAMQRLAKEYEDAYMLEVVGGMGYEYDPEKNIFENESKKGSLLP